MTGRVLLGRVGPARPHEAAELGDAVRTTRRDAVAAFVDDLRFAVGVIIERHEVREQVLEALAYFSAVTGIVPRTRTLPRFRLVDFEQKGSPYAGQDRFGDYNHARDMIRAQIGSSRWPFFKFVAVHEATHRWVNFAIGSPFATPIKGSTSLIYATEEGRAHCVAAILTSPTRYNDPDAVLYTMNSLTPALVNREQLSDAIANDVNGSTLRPFLQQHLAGTSIGAPIHYSMGSALLQIHMQRRRFDVSALLRDALTMTGVELIASAYDFVKASQAGRETLATAARA
jgi:hypothetical protein